MKNAQHHYSGGKADQNHNQRDTIPHPFSPVQLFVALGAIACQSPLCMEFSRQEYWSGLPFPPPGDLLNPGAEPRPPASQADSYCPSHRDSPHIHQDGLIKWEVSARMCRNWNPHTWLAEIQNSVALWKTAW